MFREKMQVGIVQLFFHFALSFRAQHPRLSHLSTSHFRLRPRRCLQTIPGGKHRTYRRIVRTDTYCIRLGGNRCNLMRKFQEHALI